jgi:hypothetical protein
MTSFSAGEQVVIRFGRQQGLEQALACVCQATRKAKDERSPFLFPQKKK